MTERDRPVYCTRCGSIVYPEDNYCGACGAGVAPNAPDAAPTQQIPTQVPPPPSAAAPGRTITPLTVLGFAIFFALVLGAGSVAALNLIRGQAEPSESAPDREQAALEATRETQPERGEKPADPKTATDEGDDAEEAQPKQNDAKKEEPAPDEASGPSPGYNLIETPDGGLSVEVPPSWGVETVEDSEKGGRAWSSYAGEYLFSSITTAPSLDVWYDREVLSSGAYLVASKALAQYSDYELTHSFLNANKDESCAEAGPYEDYDRPPLSGKVQTWYGCAVDGATIYTVAAAPEGRECVVALSARVSEEADREAIEHLVDTVEVDCGRVTSGRLPASSASASPSASREASASASGSASAQVQSAGPTYNFIEVPMDTPPCPLGLDEVRATYGPNVTCGEGGGYVPAAGGR